MTRLRAMIAATTVVWAMVGCGSLPTAPIGSVSPSLPAFAPDNLAKIDAVLDPMRELLRLAPDVARVKWNEKRPVANRATDTALVEAAAQQAPRYGGDPALYRAVFRALVEASNYAQGELIKQWADQKRPPTQTLTRTPVQIQAVSDEVSPRLLKALAEVTPVLALPGARAAIEARAKEFMPSSSSALAEPTRNMAIAPLLARAAN